MEKRAKKKLFDFGLESLKKKYDNERAKHSLPSFAQLNEQFEIERIADHETDMLLREVRKAITEKAVAFLRFLELMLNPSNAPFFMFTIIKNLNGTDKKVVEQIYEKLCEFEIKAISLDLRYNEEKEAEFIKYASKEWKGMEGQFAELDEIITRAWKSSSKKKERDYFG